MPSLSHVLVLSTLLFALGLLGVMVRRHLVFVLLSIEIMLNAAGLALIAGGAHHSQSDGQVMFLFVLAVAATHVSIGLALLLALNHHTRRLDSDRQTRLSDHVAMNDTAP